VSATNAGSEYMVKGASPSGFETRNVSIDRKIGLT
jgi:hypothetical protein